jgi:Fe-S-cluster containining protein
MLPEADSQLIQIVDAATADAARRAGSWLKCRKGCTQCCVGVFAITQLDALRLRQGLVELELADPVRATAVRQRAQQSVNQLTPDFPGDPVTGLLDDSAEDRFDTFANEEACPALDLSTGTCDLYTARPMTCRIFGPPIRSQDGIGVCELCFQGATEQEILAAELNMDWSGIEESVNAEAEQVSGQAGTTIVAFALLR